MQDKTTKDNQVAENSAPFVSQVQNLANVQNEITDKRLQQVDQAEANQYQLNATGGPLE